MRVMSLHFQVTDMNAGEVVHEINVRGQQQRLDFDPEKPPVKHDASGVQQPLSQEAYYREILAELRTTTLGGTTPINRCKGPIP